MPIVNHEATDLRPVDRLNSVKKKHQREAGIRETYVEWQVELGTTTVPQNKELERTWSSQTDWGPRRSIQCSTRRE